jgi:hypothetical protein
MANAGKHRMKAMIKDARVAIALIFPPENESETVA